MRRARFTYIDAFHHLMNRGINGEPIFKAATDKECFTDLLDKFSKLLKVRILAYCLLDNHYHLVLQNTSGNMSEFAKRLNGNYGNYYRKMYGGRGYVFQSRYKSTAVQEDSYLIMSLLYLFLNPVRAGIVADPFSYHWSSIHELFNESMTVKICDTDFVESLFGCRETLVASLNDWKNRELPVDANRFGEFLGDHTFDGKCEQRFSRRKEKLPEKRKERKRIFDQYFRSPGDVIREFEEEMGFRFGRTSRHSLEFKRLRGELLVRLKDTCGLKYFEIKCFPIFEDLKSSSMGQLYKRTKVRLEANGR